MSKIKPMLITIEGVDAVGKGTQTKKLTKYLEESGYQVENFEFPRYNTFFGKVISKYLTGEFGDINQVPKELICIAYASDRASAQHEIKNALDNGKIVISDRYTHSNFFSVAKLPKKDWDTFISWIEEMEYDGFNIIKPDHTFYLYMDTSITLKRIEERGKRTYQDEKEDIHENNPTLLTKAAECYLHYGEKQSKEKWTSINQMKDGNQMSPNEISEIIINRINELMQI